MKRGRVGGLSVIGPFSGNPTTEYETTQFLFRIRKKKKREKSRNRVCRK